MEQQFKHKFKDFKVKPSAKLWKGIAGAMAGSTTAFLATKIKVLSSLLALTTVVALILGGLFINEKKKNTETANIVMTELVMPEKVYTKEEIVDDKPILIKEKKTNDQINQITQLNGSIDKPTYSTEQNMGLDIPVRKQTASKSNENAASLPDKILTNSSKITKQNQALAVHEGFSVSQKYLMGKIATSKINSLNKQFLPLHYSNSFVFVPKQKESLINYVGFNYGQKLPLNRLKYEVDFNRTEGIIKSEESNINTNTFDVNFGKSAGHYIFETGIAFQSAKSNVKLHIREYEDVQETRIVYDSINFVFNTIDSVFETVFSERLDTFLNQKAIDKSIQTNRRFTALQIPLFVGYKYSYDRLSLALKAGLIANLTFSDQINNTQVDLPAGFQSEIYQLYWSLSLNPEIWYSISDKVDVRVGINYNYNLNTEGIKNDYWFMANSLLLQTGVSYWLN
jgi:hypothetical protein